MKTLRRALIAFVVVIFGFLLLSVLVSWPYPSRDTAAAWERNFDEGIVPGYTDFQGHWLNADIGAYIFSYRCPDAPTLEQLFSDLVRKNPDFMIYSKTSDELALRQPVTSSTPDGFNEWRFVFRPKTRRMTVMYANLDDEQAAHSRLVATLRKYRDGD